MMALIFECMYEIDEVSSILYATSDSNRSNRILVGYLQRYNLKLATVISRNEKRYSTLVKAEGLFIIVN